MSFDKKHQMLALFQTKTKSFNPPKKTKDALQPPLLQKAKKTPHLSPAPTDSLTAPGGVELITDGLQNRSGRGARVVRLEMSKELPVVRCFLFFFTGKNHQGDEKNMENPEENDLQHVLLEKKGLGKLVVENASTQNDKSGQLAASHSRGWRL